MLSFSHYFKLIVKILILINSNYSYFLVFMKVSSWHTSVFQLEIMFVDYSSCKHTYYCYFIFQ